MIEYDLAAWDWCNGYIYKLYWNSLVEYDVRKWICFLFEIKVHESYD